MNRLAFLTLLLNSCSAPPFIPPEVPQDVRVEPRTCREYETNFSDYIVGVPSVIRIRHSWDYRWCVVVREDWRGFEGEWYFADWDTSFDDWEQLNQVVLYVDNRPLAWYIDGAFGFDPTYDVAPHLSFSENQQSTREEGYLTRVCVPVKVELDAYTSKERVDFTYHIDHRVCPDPGWSPPTE